MKIETERLLDALATVLMDVEEYFSARDEMNARIHIAETRWSPITLQVRVAIEAWQKHRFPDGTHPADDEEGVTDHNYLCHHAQEEEETCG